MKIDFTIEAQSEEIHVSVIFWCTNPGRIRTDCGLRISGVGLPGPDHNHWFDYDSERQAIIVCGFDPRAVRI